MQISHGSLKHNTRMGAAAAMKRRLCSSSLPHPHHGMMQPGHTCVLACMHLGTRYLSACIAYTSVRICACVHAFAQACVRVNGVCACMF